MSTANFSVINARGYYTILDTYECEDENGVMQTYQRDEWDFEDIMNNIRYNSKFPYPSKDWNDKMDAKELCMASEWEIFGNGNAWTTDMCVESTIVIRSGYYSGAVLDYDIRLETSQGDEFFLSDYDNVDDMVDNYLDIVGDIVSWKGHNHKWNDGTFKIQKKNIRKWIEKRVEDEIEKCESFCKERCDCQLAVRARFSNGETWYTKVG